MSTLTLQLNSKEVMYLTRGDGGVKDLETSLGTSYNYVIRTLPNPPSSDIEARTNVAVMDTVRRVGKKEKVVKANREVFVKWSKDARGIIALGNEASFYCRELKELQGEVVPDFYGYFADSLDKPRFACVVLEYCSGVLPDDYHEYYRQYMVLACRLHSAGVAHTQLLSSRHHVIPHENGLRIVDFTQAQRHKCQSCFPIVSRKPLGGNECPELELLEKSVGKRTGMTDFHNYGQLMH